MLLSGACLYFVCWYEVILTLAPAARFRVAANVEPCLSSLTVAETTGQLSSSSSISGFAWTNRLGVDPKRVARIYRSEGLAIRTKTPRRRQAAAVREAVVPSTAPNQSWAMDFMHDILADGTKIRLLTIVDTFSRESVALEVDYGFKSPQVVEVLQRAVAQRGAPDRIHCDNGPEFVSLQLDQWADWTHVSSPSRGWGAHLTTPFANRSTTARVKNC